MHPWGLTRKHDGGWGKEALLDQLYKEMALSRNPNDMKDGATSLSGEIVFGFFFFFFQADQIRKAEKSLTYSKKSQRPV